MADAVHININVGNLSKTIANMDKYGELLDKAFQEGIYEFGEKLQAKIYENMSAYGVPASVVKSVSLIHKHNGLEVHIAGELVEFFEYGTGIKGATVPHPDPFSPWVYDENEHGSSGWWYPTTSADPNPYKWTDASGQLRAWTTGKISRPFIYDSFVWGRSSISNIVRKHINKIKM